MRGSSHPGRSVEHTTVPKPGGGVRHLSVLGPQDARAYAQLVGRLTPAIERRLGPEVFANRAPGGEGLEPWRQARARWRRATERLLRTGPVATMDVSRYYDSIRPEVLAAVLSRVDPSNPAGTEVVELVKRLRDAGVAGIPVGPPPSAILANAVLASVDDAIRRSGVRFVRWVDDIVLVAPDPRVLAAGERAALAALADLHLAPNLSKHHRFSDPQEAKASILRGGPRAGSGIEILAAP